MVFNCAPCLGAPIRAQGGKHVSRKHHSRKRRAGRTLHRTAPGAPPGTLVIDPESPTPEITVIAYGADAMVERRIDDPDRIGEFLGRWPVTWVNVSGLGSAETIQHVGRVFSLHPLAVEDVVHVHQRPKVERYAEHHFIVLRMAEWKGRLRTEQLSLFLGKNYVLTFQEQRGDCLDPIRHRIRNSVGQVRLAGADYLTYAIVDAVVDGYFPVLEAYGDRLEAIEDELVLHPARNAILRIHEVKHDLLVLRRAVWPLREAIDSLFPDTTPLVEESTRVYLRDCYDHTIRVIDLVENYREIAASLTDIYLSSVSNRMNEIMKVLTIIATIFMPMSFVAGVYGMNFHNMPEIGWRWGYPVSLVLMAGIAGSQLLYFWRKGWLGGATDGGPDAAAHDNAADHSDGQGDGRHTQAEQGTKT